MKAPRRLWVRFRRVDRGRRRAYRDAVITAADTADAMGTRFWAFEADGGEGRFVEFLEGPEDRTLALLHEATADSLRAGGDLETTEPQSGRAGLRCTEFG